MVDETMKANVGLTEREARLEAAKSVSIAQMLPSADESARLFTAANAGTGLAVEAGVSSPPYTPAVVRSLAIAALAALGAAGDEARANTDALTVESNNEFCLNMSKLMLYQCLAASRPSYEDMFCMGRHIVRDLATCTTEATQITTIVVDCAIATPKWTPTLAVRYEPGRSPTARSRSKMSRSPTRSRTVSDVAAAPAPARTPRPAQAGSPAPR